MRKLSLLAFIICINLNAQEYLTPTKAATFALNKHTNRDIAYFTNIDSSGNIFNIGTTERDSTFTDIISSKLDENLSLIWQKRFSINTNLSYDIPLSSYIDTNDNLIVVGRSSFNQSNSNGLLFIIKYDINGKELWSKTIGNIDGSDYYNYEYYNSYFNNDTLRITYIPYNSETSNGNGESEIKFLKIDTNGNITEEFFTSVSNNGIHSTYHNGIHYTLIRKDDGSDYSYYLRKVGAGIDENYHLNIQPNFVQENFNPILEEIKLKVDSNQNLYLIKPKIEGYGSGVAITKINKIGEIVYSHSKSSNYDLIGSYIDTNDKLCILFEDSTVNKIFKNTLDDSGDDLGLNSINYSNLSGSRLNEDNTLFVLDNNDIITLLNKDLIVLNSFNYSKSFLISEITKVNNSEIIISGTTYDKMYASSDFFTQNNITLERLNPNQIINTYTFSGEGTSKAFQQRLIIDNDNNYLVFSQEKLGPDNWQIGGSRAPLHKSISKYDSNLSLIWTLSSDNFLLGTGSSLESNIVVDSENNVYINSYAPSSGTSSKNFELIKINPNGKIIFKVPSFQDRSMYFDQNNNVNIASPPMDNNITFDDDTSIYSFDSNSGDLLSTSVLEGLEFLKHYKSQDGNSYIYMYTGSNSSGDTSPRMDIYKNLTLDFSVNLAITGTYGSIGAFDVSKNGDLYFGSSWGQINEKLHKITLSNTYSYIHLDERYSRLRLLNNGKIFTIVNLGGNNEGRVKIYNDDLTEFSSNSEIVYNYSEILEINNFILLNSYYDNLVKVFNENSTLVDEFKIPSNFGYAELDSNNDIILTGQFGNQIYTFHEYSWARGLLHKYDYKKPIDTDNDGIGDSIDICSDTPEGEHVDTNGCSQSQKDDDNDGIMNDKDLCPNTPVGDSVNLEGCSESELDDDDDGVMNDKDQCPNTSEGITVNTSGCISIASNNFNIQTIGETCPDKDNAQIVISASEIHDYVASFNGIDYPFTSNLTIQNIAPGTYDLCISIPTELYEQCFSLTLEEGTTISGKTSSTKSGTAAVVISQGTAPYTVIKNGEIVLTTVSKSFEVNTSFGDIIEVTTSKSCEGKLSKTMDLVDYIFAYPNPTKGKFEIASPVKEKQVLIETYTAKSQLITSSMYKITNGKIELDFNDKPNGIYFVIAYLEEPVTIKVIKN